MSMMYNFQQPNHQQHHTPHQGSHLPDHATHSTNGSSLGHAQFSSSGVLSNSTPSFTPSGLQNGHTTVTRGGQAQQITEHWAEQLRLHKESEDANASMLGGQSNHFARQRAGENRGLTTASNVDTVAAEEEDNEERGRPYRQETVKRQDWHNMDLSGQGLRALASPLFNYGFLNELYIASNKLTQLPPAIGQLRHLRHLDASYNQITELPRELAMCVYLKKLLVFNNQIRILPNEIGSLYQLELLGIEGNPLDQAQKHAIMERGTKSLIENLREEAPIPLPPPERQTIPLADVSASHDKFKIASFNILCDKACTSQLYGYTPSNALQWDYRRDVILESLRAQDADILCLQEVDSETMTEFLSPKLSYDGYKGFYWQKTRAKTMHQQDRNTVDGCATFYKSDKYILLEKQIVEMSNIAINRPDMKNQHDIFNRVMPRDNIGVIAFLENRMTGSRLVVANTHLHWDPVYPDVKLIQTAILIEQINKMTERFTKKPALTDKAQKYGLVDEDALETDPQEPAPSMEYSSNTQIPFVFCGDLNSTSDSSVFELLAKGSIKPSHKELSNYQYGNFSKSGIDHPFSLRSAYSALDKTPDQLTFTNCTPGFNDVIDHIWYSSNTLELGSLLGGVDAEYMKTVPGFPNHHFPSDHLLLVAEFAVKGRKEKKTHPEPDFGSSSRRRD